MYPVSSRESPVTVYCENIVENLFSKMFTYCFQFMQIMNVGCFCSEANVLYIICRLSERILMGKQLHILFEWNERQFCQIEWYFPTL